jgi:hypothetical protein
MVLAGSSAYAQRLEVAPIIGYTTSATLDRTADEVDELKINGGTTWGARGTYLVTERLGVEAMWTYQATELTMSAAASSAELFEMSINQVYGHVTYEFGNGLARLRPFIFGGVGATFLGASDLDGEVKPAWDVGGGVKWFLQRHFGIEGRVRYKPTELSDSSGRMCGPFDFCQGTLGNVGIATTFFTRF